MKVLAATLVQVLGVILVVRGLAAAWAPLGWIAAGLALIVAVSALPEPEAGVHGSGSAPSAAELDAADLETLRWPTTDGR